MGRADRTVTDFVCNECGYRTTMDSCPVLAAEWNVIPRGWSAVTCFAAEPMHLCCLGCVKKLVDRVDGRKEGGGEP